jgi:hypothetical protein
MVFEMAHVSFPMESEVQTEKEVPKKKDFLSPFDDLSSYTKLTCQIHEICDLECDPDNPPVVRAVDVSAYDSSDEDIPDDFIPGALQYTMAPPFPTKYEAPQRAMPTEVKDSVDAFDYQSLPLSNNHIRLLRVKPAIYLADVLDCELVAMPIDEAPHYDALSYCWGDISSQSKILLNLKKHQINKTLDEALHRYRRLGGKSWRRIWRGKSDFIWADGICIDQSNLEEKKRQVMMMEQIFRRARRVFVDLGDVPDNWIGGLYLMQAIRSVITSPVGMLNAKTLFEVIKLPRPDHMAWPALGYVFEMPWFRRTWVMQEVVLATNDPVMMFGKYSFEFSLLVLAWTFISGQGYLNALQPYNPRRAKGMLNLKKMDHIRNGYRKGNLLCAALMDSMRDFEATDPRDKIYGVLSIMQPEDRVIPDYSLSVEEVYTKFATLRVHKGDGGRLLDKAGLQRRFPHATLPSWVPDWRAQTQVPRVVATIREIPFSSSPIDDPRFGPVEESRTCQILHTRAALVDTLSATIEPFRGEHTDAEFLALVKQALELVLSGGPKMANVYPQPGEALSRTLLMDDLYLAGQNTILQFGEIKDPWKVVQTMLGDPKLFVDAGSNASMGRITNEMETFHMQALTATAQRRFAISEKGHFGLVPEAAQVGDQIFILAGASVPHILRRSVAEATCYELVGDAYIHGVMHGEYGPVGSDQFGQYKLI